MLTNGFCNKHGLWYQLCDKCTNEDNIKRAEAWLIKQSNIAVTKQDRLISHNKYVSICGDPSPVDYK